jgi:hypothetical protein
MSFKFNPITGQLDLVNASAPENFSYKKILVGESKAVPLNQQMLFDGDLLVQGDLSKRLLRSTMKDSSTRLFCQQKT